MSTHDKLLARFNTVFGENGGDVFPGNSRGSLDACPVCRDVMVQSEPILFDYFEAWEARSNDRKPHAVEQHLIALGQWEGAWALAQLHYDQLLKKESRIGSRLHKGHPLCNLALIGRAIDSPTLTRHYALLSSAGDIYWKHSDQQLAFGGLAPTLLEQFESQEVHTTWRRRIEERIRATTTTTPLYLESLLASRWFTDAYGQHLIPLWEVVSRTRTPFVDVLLDAVLNPGESPSAVTGARFEAAAGLLISATPGFEVDSARKTSDEQIDLVVRYRPERLASLALDAGCGLIECKSSEGRVSSSELRDFGAKCLFHRVRFGILISRAGTTGGGEKFTDPQYAELVRRRFQNDGLTLLVVDARHFPGKSRTLRGLQDDLCADFNEVVFGPVA